MKAIQTFIWYDDQAEEAAKLYTSIFKNSKILGTMPGPGGTVMGVTFELEGNEYIAFNGGPHWKINGAISFFVNCTTQEEVDHYWDSLSEGGNKDRCGWLQDKFGVSWQIVPTALGKYLSDKNPAKAGSVMQAMLKMSKLDIAELTKAYEAV